MPVFSLLSDKDNKIKVKLVQKYHPKDKLEFAKILVRNRQYRLLAKLPLNYSFRTFYQTIKTGLETKVQVTP